jgi:hypothetical protein
MVDSHFGYIKIPKKGTGEDRVFKFSPPKNTYTIHIISNQITRWGLMLD